jgi:hypothetical protein
MANTVDLSLVTTANTFDQWRIQTNLSANDVNEIARGNFTKPTGNITLTVGKIILSNATGTTLDVTADARVSGKVSLKNFEQDGGAAYFYSDSADIQFRSANSTIHANGNTRTRFLYNNTFFSAANINATGFIETTGATANANLIMNVGGVLTVRTVANSSNVAIIGNLSVSNVATLGNARITLANVTTLNTSTIVVSTANVATLNVNASGAVANIANANIANLATANVIATAARATSLNATTGNITTLSVTTLTVTDPISAPAEVASESYRLRVGLSPRGVGTFGVFQGTSNGNAAIRFNTTGNVWQTTANDIAGVYGTVITTANVQTTYSTDTANVASAALVNGANVNAIAALVSSNASANMVRVSANTGSTIAKANGINFNNTSTISVAVGAGINGNANVSFAVVGGLVQGATGAQGATGTGTQGAIGASGSQGAVGAGTQGAIGASGSNGAQGAIGSNGSNGAQGAIGTSGSNGAQGAIGATGSTGSTGSPGAQGAIGSNGSNGAQGTIGASGSNGAQGAIGATGSTGSTGATGSAGPSNWINASSSSGTWYPVGVTATGGQYPYLYSVFYHSGGTVYSTDFSASSDLRLKNVLGYVGDAVEIVEQLNGIRYTWNNIASAEFGIENTKPHEIGLIAQEVREVIPEAVTEDDKGYLHVSYDRVVPVLVEAIKELNARIKVLEGK